MDAFPHIKYAVKSDIGRKRKNNEDSFGAFPTVGVFCVADGMGGGDDGEVASAATVRAIETFAKDCQLPQKMTYPLPDIVADIRAHLNDASSWILERAKERHLKGCGSTFVGVCLDASHPESAMALHAGDSRLYRIRGRSIQQITRDHSAAELIGAKDESEVNPMFRGLILRAVGIQSTVEIEETPLAIKEGDKILLCSDGLSRMVTDKQMLSIVRSANSVTTAVDALIAAANAAGGVDNVTAVLLEVGELPAALPVVEMPSAFVRRENMTMAASVEAVTQDTDNDNRDSDGVFDIDPSSSSDSHGVREPEPDGSRDTVMIPEESDSDGADADRDQAQTDCHERGPSKSSSVPSKACASVMIFLVIAALGVGLVVMQSRLAREGAEDSRLTVAPQEEAQKLREEQARLEKERKEQEEAQKRREEQARLEKERKEQEEQRKGEILERKRVVALAAFEEVCNLELQSAPFVRKVSGVIEKELPTDLTKRFRPLSKASSLSQEKKLEAAVALTKDVQVIVARLENYAKMRLRDEEDMLADPLTSSEYQKQHRDVPKKITSFLADVQTLVKGDPTDPDVQFKCVLVMHSVPQWL